MTDQELREEVMTPDLPEDVREALASFASKEPHLYACIGYSEGQSCCLEQPEVQDFISSLLAVAKAEGADERLNLQNSHEGKLYLFKDKEVFREYMADIRAEGYREGVEAMQEKTKYFVFYLKEGNFNHADIGHCADQLLNPRKDNTK